MARRSGMKRMGHDRMDAGGTLRRRDGSLYTGRWKQDRMNGSGEMKFSDGGPYRGTSWTT